jgi:soluble lytic murein transglycosylase-like protein
MRTRYPGPTRVRHAVALIPLRPILWTVCCLALAAPAHAQIYTWRDANGHLVLSNRPAAGAEPTYVVRQAESVRATRPDRLTRGREYDELIAEHAHLNAVRTDLVRAVVQVESAFNPYAKSTKGALGLMQLMPATILRFGVKNPFNPGENVRAGVAYLRQLLDRYGNDEQLALAAYNAGPGAVDRYGQSVPPYLETQHYVARINGLAAPAPAVKPRGRPIVVYKSTEIVDGRTVLKFSNTQPSIGPYEVIGPR